MNGKYALTISSKLFDKNLLKLYLAVMLATLTLNIEVSREVTWMTER